MTEPEFRLDSLILEHSLLTLTMSPLACIKQSQIPVSFGSLWLLTSKVSFFHCLPYTINFTLHTCQVTLLNLLKIYASMYHPPQKPGENKIKEIRFKRKSKKGKTKKQKAKTPQLLTLLFLVKQEKLYIFYAKSVLEC